MSVRPSTKPYVQEMPPPGGYRPLNFERAFPERGPKGWQIWAGAAFTICYGFYQVGRYNTDRNQQKMQERKIKYALAPVMQAEADREWCLRELIHLKKEAHIMKDVVGWKVGANPYYSGVWMPRATNQLGRNNRQ